MHNVLEITDTIIDYKLFFTLVKRLPPALLFYLAKRCIVVVKAEYRTYFFPIGCRHPHHFMTFVCSFFWEKKENSHVWSQGCLLFSIGPWLCDFLFCLLPFFFGILGRNNSVDDGLCRRASRMLPRTDQTGGWPYFAPKGMYVYIDTETFF